MFPRTMVRQGIGRFGGGLLVLLLMGSCDQQGLQPDSLGAVAEIMLDCRPEEWQGETGRRLRKALSAEQYGLPQPEPWFRLLPTQDLGANKFKDRHRLILRLRSAEQQSSLPKELRTASAQSLAAQGIYLGVVRHPRAFPQSEVWLVYRDTATLFAFLDPPTSPLLDRLRQLDQRLIMDRVGRLSRADTLIALIKDSLGFSLSALPGDYRIRSLKRDWVWLSREIPNGTMNWCLWRVKDAADLPLVAPIFRDSLLQRTLPGPSPGSYYQTERLVPTRQRSLPLGPKAGSTVVEIRGLWTMHGDFMGGPFVHHTWNSGKDRLHSEVFVYNPNEPKRAWLRELESLSLACADSMVQRDQSMKP